MRRTRRTSSAALALLVAAAAPACDRHVDLAPSSAGSALASYGRARQLVERALDVMGSPEAVSDAGGLRFEATGTMNQGVERQGRAPGTLDPALFREMFAVDPAADRVAYEYRHDRYDGTWEWTHELYLAPHERVIVGPPARFAVILEAERHRSERLRLLRRVPHFLLGEALGRAAGLRWLGRREGLEWVSVALIGGDVIDLAFDSERGTLAIAEYLTDIQTLGDAAVSWRFSDYAPLAGLGLFPRSYAVHVGGRPFTEMEVEEVALGGDRVSGMFEIPDGLEAPRIPLREREDASINARVREVAPGVYQVVSLRPGFHPMFVEFGDFVLAIDAPAGYRLLNELPAGDVAPGPSGSWLSERFIQLIRETIPDKPVRYVVLTHFHNDHAGGLRAFIAEGATVLAASTALAAVERFAIEPHTLAPDRLSGSTAELRARVVQGDTVITDGERSVEVLRVGTNPHTDDMLVVWIPEAGIVFVSDLLTPASPAAFPTPDHEALDRWFGAWLARRGLDPEWIYAMHGSGRLSRDLLQRIRPGDDG